MQAFLRAAGAAGVRGIPGQEPLIFNGPRGSPLEALYVPPDSLTDEWRYDVESIVAGKRLRVVVELPDDPPNVLVVTVIAVE
jgi:hypothetical protein